MTAASPALPLATPVAAPRQIARLTYRFAVQAYVVAIATQVMLAGVYVFVGPQTIVLHRTFALVCVVLTLAIAAAAFAGRLPAPARRDAVVTAGLLVVQGLLVHALVISPLIAAFHPVNAMLMFWWAVGTARRAA